MHQISYGMCLKRVLFVSAYIKEIRLLPKMRRFGNQVYGFQLGVAI